MTLTWFKGAYSIMLTAFSCSFTYASHHDTTPIDCVKPVSLHSSSDSLINATHSSPYPHIPNALKHSIVNAAEEYQERHHSKALTPEIKDAIQHNAEKNAGIHMQKQLLEHYQTLSKNIFNLVVDANIDPYHIHFIKHLMNGRLLPHDLVVGYFEGSQSREQDALNLLRMGISILNHRQWNEPLHPKFNTIVQPLAAECFFITSTWHTRHVMNDMYTAQHHISHRPHYIKTIEGRNAILNTLESLIKELSWSLYQNMKGQHKERSMLTAYHLHNLKELIKKVMSPIIEHPPTAHDIVTHAPLLREALDQNIFLNVLSEPASYNDLTSVLFKTERLLHMGIAPYVTHHDTMPLVWNDGRNRALSAHEAGGIFKTLFNNGQHYFEHTLKPTHRTRIHKALEELHHMKDRYASLFDDMHRQFFPLDQDEVDSDEETMVE